MYLAFCQILHMKVVVAKRKMLQLKQQVFRSGTLYQWRWSMKLKAFVIVTRGSSYLYFFMTDLFGKSIIFLSTFQIWKHYIKHKTIFLCIQWNINKEYTAIISNTSVCAIHSWTVEIFQLYSPRCTLYFSLVTDQWLEGKQIINSLSAKFVLTSISLIRFGSLW